MRKIYVVALLLGCSMYAQAQSEDAPIDGNFIGFQANELVRQLLSFSDTSIPDNPYFVNYTRIYENGGGFNIGFAYQADEFSQEINFNSLTTEISNLALRFGYEKKAQIDKRFNYSIAFDFLIESLTNKTTTEDNFGGSDITTETSTSGFGLGPRFTLNYAVTDRIMIGTEANYYFKSLTEKFENSLIAEDDESTIQRFDFTPPAVLWLTIRLDNGSSKRKAFFEGN